MADSIAMVLASLQSQDATSWIWATLCLPFAAREFVAWTVGWRLRSLSQTEGVARSDFPKPNSYARAWLVLLVASVLAWVPAFATTALLPGLSADLARAVFLIAGAVAVLYLYLRLRGDDRRFREIIARSARERAAAFNDHLQGSP